MLVDKVVTLKSHVMHELRGKREQIKSTACISIVEPSGSGVELQTLDYENLGSNPVLRC